MGMDTVRNVLLINKVLTAHAKRLDCSTHVKIQVQK